MAMGTVDIGIDLNTKSATQALNSLKSKINSTFNQQGTKTFDQSLKQTENNIRSLERKAEELRNKMRALIASDTPPKSVTAMEQELERTIQKSNKAGIEVEKLRAKYQELNAEISRKERVREYVSPQEAANLQIVGEQLRIAENEVDKASVKIDELHHKLELVKVNPQATEEYKKLENELTVVNGKLEEQKNIYNTIQSKQGDILTYQNNIRDSVKQSSSEFMGMFNSFQKFGNRIISLAKRVFFFSLITRGLRQLRTGLGNIIKQNSALSASLAQIKGNLMTAFAPIWSSVIPALQTMLNWLVSATGAIAQFIAILSGKSINDAQRMGKELFNQAKGYGAAAGGAKDATEAAEEYQKTLLGFDKLNILESSKDKSGSSGGAGDISTIDFDMTEHPFMTSLAMKAREIFFDWDFSNLSGKQILDKIEEGLFSLCGGIIGWSFGGVGGALIGTILGATIGLIVAKLTDPESDDEASINEAWIKSLGTLIAGIIGAVIGTFAFGGIVGGALGFSVGTVIGLLLTTLEWDEDPKGVITRVIGYGSVGALIGALIGLIYGGPLAGGILGFSVGASIALLIEDLGVAKGFTREDNATVASTLAGVICGIIGGAIGAQFGVHGAFIGGVLGFTIGATVTLGISRLFVKRESGRVRDIKSKFGLDSEQEVSFGLEADDVTLLVAGLTTLIATIKLLLPKFKQKDKALKDQKKEVVGEKDAVTELSGAYALAPFAIKGFSDEISLAKDKVKSLNPEINTLNDGVGASVPAFDSAKEHLQLYHPELDTAKDKTIDFADTTKTQLSDSKTAVKDFSTDSTKILGEYRRDGAGAAVSAANSIGKATYDAVDSANKNVTNFSNNSSDTLSKWSTNVSNNTTAAASNFATSWADALKTTWKNIFNFSKNYKNPFDAGKIEATKATKTAAGIALGITALATGVALAPYTGGLSLLPILGFANGGVFPANKPFLGVLGDQKNGTNIEAPLGTIEQAVSNVVNTDLLKEMKKSNMLQQAALDLSKYNTNLLEGKILPATTSFTQKVYSDNLRTQTDMDIIDEHIRQGFNAMVNAIVSSSRDTNINFTGNLSQLARVLTPAIEKEKKRTGTKLVTGGAF